MFIILLVRSSPKSYSKEMGNISLKLMILIIEAITKYSRRICSIFLLTLFSTAIESIQPWIKVPTIFLISSAVHFLLIFCPSKLFVTFEIVPMDFKRSPCTFCNFRPLDLLHKQMKFSIKDFLSKCDQSRSFLRIWSHLLKKSLMKNFTFCTLIKVLNKRFHSKFLDCIF